MIPIIIAAMCAGPVLILPAGQQPNEYDLKIVASAKMECRVRYPFSQCLKSVTRTGLNDYSIICTKPKVGE